MIFDPYPPTVGIFFVLSVGKFGEILTPPPLKNVDVLNGWSPMLNADIFNTSKCPSRKYSGGKNPFYRPNHIGTLEPNSFLFARKVSVTSVVEFCRRESTGA